MTARDAVVSLLDVDKKQQEAVVNAIKLAPLRGLKRLGTKQWRRLCLAS